MRRWILIFVVAVQAAVLITLSGPMGAMAATSSSNNFKGKPSVYYRTSSAYFVVNFTCSSGQLSGNWTWETSSGVSYGGTLAASGCSWSSGTSMSNITLSARGTANTATLNLVLSNISGTKTYVPNTTTCVNNPSKPPCIVIQTSGLGMAVGDDNQDFTSNPGSLSDTDAPYGTLTVSVR